MTCRPGAPEPVVIELHRGKPLDIRAIGPDGKPVSSVDGACYQLGNDNRGDLNGTHFSDGHFRLSAEPGRKYQVYLHSSDANAGLVTELEAPADGHTIDVQLKPCATIRGRYVFSGGGPAADIENYPKFRESPDKEPSVDAELHNLPFYNNFARVQWTKSMTDADGRFELPGIVPGMFLYLHLNYQYDDGHIWREVGVLEPGQVKDVGDLVISSR